MGKNKFIDSSKANNSDFSDIGLRYVVITSCNANCYFCLNEYVGTKSRSTSLLPEDYGKISRSAFDLGFQKTTISGGEPTMRGDLDKIISEVTSAGMQTTLVSNGYKLNDFLDAYRKLDELHVSYHTFDEGEWERITKVKDGPKRVRDNLLAVRNSHQDLSIRLNVVSSDENARPEIISRYVELAREIGSGISLFQNGYLRMLQKVGKLVECEKPRDFWDLNLLGGKLVERTPRKSVYEIDGVKISLTRLSSEMCTGTSCWVTPMGEGFSDVQKRVPLVNLKRAIELGDNSQLSEGIKSLVIEAKILRELEVQGINPQESREYNDLINRRGATLETVANSYTF